MRARYEDTPRTTGAPSPLPFHDAVYRSQWHMGSRVGRGACGKRCAGCGLQVEWRAYPSTHPSLVVQRAPSRRTGLAQSRLVAVRQSSASPTRHNQRHSQRPSQRHLSSLAIGSPLPNDTRPRLQLSVLPASVSSGTCVACIVSCLPLRPTCTWHVPLVRLPRVPAVHTMLAVASPSRPHLKLLCLLSLALHIPLSRSPSYPKPLVLPSPILLP